MKHIVMWKLKDSLTDFEKQQLMLEFKHNMKDIQDILEGIIKLEVIINELESSNMDMMLISEFKNQEVLEQYQKHPKHIAASNCLSNMVDIRSCIDYIEK